MGRRDRQLNCVTPLSGQTLPADYAWAAESAEVIVLCAPYQSDLPGLEKGWMEALVGPRRHCVAGSVADGADCGDISHRTDGVVSHRDRYCLGAAGDGENQGGLSDNGYLVRSSRWIRWRSGPGQVGRLRWLSGGEATR